MAELNKIWHTNPMAKKSEVDVGKGFERIYFVIAALWVGLSFIYVFNNGLKDMSEVFEFIIAVVISSQNKGTVYLSGSAHTSIFTSTKSNKNIPHAVAIT